MVLMMVMMRMMEKEDEQGCLKLGEAALAFAREASPSSPSINLPPDLSALELSLKSTSTLYKGYETNITVEYQTYPMYPWCPSIIGSMIPLITDLSCQHS